MKYIDIHSHLNFPEYDADREEVFKRSADAGIGMIIVGTDIDSSKRAVELARGRDNVWATVGIHPIEGSGSTSKSGPVGDYTESSRGWLQLKELALDPKVVAIGECGLDYFHAQPEDIAEQKNIFEQHIALANEVNKPLMLHVRNGKGGGSAYREAVEMLQRHSRVRANFHFFAGTKDDVAAIIAINGTVSFTGVLTFTHDYDEVVRSTSFAHIMSETDCPFVSPVPYRGKRNEPAYVVEVVRAMARIRREDEGLVASQLIENAQKFFHI